MQIWYSKANGGSNVLRQRNSEKEAEQLIEAAMVRNEIDPERIQFLNANGPLAHSSQGEVHLVEFGGDTCAAKVISTANMTLPEQTQLYKSFQAEFALMCSIKHPRVVRVYGASFFKDPSRLVLVMEHATKGSLRAMLDARNAPLSAEGANALAFDIACGMEALYEKEFTTGT